MGIRTEMVCRASNLAGIRVRNPEADSIGEIEDVVIELSDGDVAYAVLRFHDWFQNKLFAVPWSELTVAHDEGGRRYLILDTTRERLKNAPGFNPDDWPDVASDEWREEVDAHYDVGQSKDLTLQNDAAKPGETTSSTVDSGRATPTG